VTVLVPVVLVVDGVLDTLPPHPASAKVTASVASSVSMAANGARFIGWTCAFARGYGRPSGAPYQALATPACTWRPFCRSSAARRPLSGSVEVSTQAPARPSVAEPAGAAPKRGAHSAWLLVVCCVAQFMVILDLSIVNVALPHIQLDLEFTAPQLQWVVDAYAITFAGFLMFGGRAADHFGQRRMFVIALLVFALASLAGGLAPDRGTLIAARAAQGFGGALMAACSLAIITSSFAPGPQLHRAIGAWAAMNGLGGAAGMLFGGIITQELTWRWVLLINPPIGLAAAAVAWAVVRERRRGSGSHPPRSFDLAGAVTLTVGQMVLVYGVVEAGLSGWRSASALGPILGGIALLGVFGLIEARLASQPLIPFKELTRPLRVANNIVLLFSASLFPMWFVSSLYLQQVLGLSPLHTGLIFLPMTLMIMLVASRAGRLVGHFGVRAVLGGGLVMLTAGLLLMSKVGPSGSGVVYIMLPGLLAAAGIAMSIVPSTIAATQGAKEGQAGLASGLVNTSRQVGGGLGLAVLVTLATQHTTHLIGAGVAVPQALTDGFRLAYLIGAGLTGAAALMTFAAVPRPAVAAVGSPRRLGVAVALVLAGFLALDAAFAGSHGAPVGEYLTGDTYHFVTAPSLRPPKLRVTRRAPVTALAPGYILTANFYDLNEPPMIGQSGPLILDRSLQPVWFQPVPKSKVAANLSPQSYEGRPALAWWQGVVTNTGQTESGEDVVVNQHYQTVARLKGRDGWILTLHELVIRGDDAWVTANKNIPLNLSKYGGAYNGALIDSAVQEYNLKTGALLYTWDALKHIPLSDSYATEPTNGFPWDAYHVNSISVTDDGAFLVSMRNTWAAYLVSIASGRIVWTLGGKRSSFEFSPGAAFQWQHDVMLQPPSSSSRTTTTTTPVLTVTLFDDHCCQQTGGGTSVPATGPSRGLLLRLDQRARTATLIAQYPGSVETEYMGDTEPLQNGDVFVGWGSEPYFSEYSRSGKLLFEGQLPRPDLTYRATLAPWVGLPLSPPLGAARKSAGGTTVYASWNGATEVASWRVLAGPRGGRLLSVASAARSGFETAIPLPDSASFEVQALDADGRVVATSRPSKPADYTSLEVQALDADGKVIGTSRPFAVGG
jgi:EmrB/QacA subfamily drug resistance transporter